MFNQHAKGNTIILCGGGHTGEVLVREHLIYYRKTVPFYIAEGSSPDKFLYMEGSEDAPAEVGRFLYSDYENCAILYMPYLGGQCILWSQVAKRDSLPQKCLEEFSQTCGFGVPTYSKELCTGEEILYW